MLHLCGGIKHTMPLENLTAEAKHKLLCDHGLVHSTCHFTGHLSSVNPLLLPGGTMPMPISAASET